MMTTEDDCCDDQNVLRSYSPPRPRDDGDSDGCRPHYCRGDSSCPRRDFQMEWDGSDRNLRGGRSGSDSTGDCGDHGEDDHDDEGMRGAVVLNADAIREVVYRNNVLSPCEYQIPHFLFRGDEGKGLIIVLLFK